MRVRLPDVETSVTLGSTTIMLAIMLSSCKDVTMFQNLIVVIGRDRRSGQQHFQLVVLVLMNKGLKDVATHIELY